jgi:hypothetical protein
LPDGDAKGFLQEVDQNVHLGRDVLAARVHRVDALKNARYLEPLAGLNVYLGYGAGQGTGIAPVWIRKA